MKKICKHCNTEINDNVRFCTNCGEPFTNTAKNTHPHNKSKRHKVVGKQNKSFKISSVYLAIPVILIIYLVYQSAFSAKAKNVVIENQPTVAASFQYPQQDLGMYNAVIRVENNKIVMPLDLVKEKKFVTALYQGALKSVPILAYINTEGKLVTAISICEPCNSTTFHINGENLICNSCGTTWDINNLDPISGSCGKYPPDPIPSEVKGNEIHIDESIVANWNRRI